MVPVDGQRYEVRSRSSCEAALARMLVEAGLPDQPWQTINAAGAICLRDKSIYRLAQMTVEEPDDGRLRAARFRPRLAAGTTCWTASGTVVGGGCADEAPEAPTGRAPIIEVAE
jgi:hypothetical protein